VTPTVLYKHFDTYNALRERSVLLESALKFGSPLVFNDPFDCRVIWETTGGTDQAWINKIAEWNRKANPPLPEEQALAHAALLVANGQHRVPVDLHVLSEAHRKQLATALGVSCFVATRDSLLMWSHYSDKHRGFCLGFSTTGEPLRRAMPVQYVNSYPHVHVTASDEEQMQVMVFTKSDVWAYEHEWRVMLNTVGLVAYPEDALTEVIFGLNMSDADKAALRELVDQRHHQPMVFQAARASNAYGIVVEPL